MLPPDATTLIYARVHCLFVFRSFCLFGSVLLWESAWVALPFFVFLFCLFGSEGLSLRVSYCGRVRGRRCLLSETVHLAHCHTATHAPTRPPSTLIGPHIDQSQIGCPDGHRDNGDPETCMEWNGLRGEERGVLEGLDLEGSSCRVVATSPPPNMGARLTGVKIEK